MSHSSDSKPSRVFFGSRPDVATGDRYVERDEQKHLNELIIDPTKQRTVLVGMRGCGKTQLAAALPKKGEDLTRYHPSPSRATWSNSPSNFRLTRATETIEKESSVVASTTLGQLLPPTGSSSSTTLKTSIIFQDLC